MISPLENRRFGRLVVPLEVEYHTHLLDTGELHQGKGVLRDISLSGSYLHVTDPAPFQPGQILSLTIHAPLPDLDVRNISRLKARGEVVRLDPPEGEGALYGVAINFVDGLTFSPPLTF